MSNSSFLILSQYWELSTNSILTSIPNRCSAEEYISTIDKYSFAPWRSKIENLNWRPWLSCNFPSTILNPASFKFFKAFFILALFLSDPFDLGSL